VNISRLHAVVQRHFTRAASHAWSKILRDPRKRRGRRWPFEKLIRALWAGALASAPTLRAVETLTERQGKRVPDTTLNTLLLRLKPRPFGDLLVKEVKAAWRSKELTSLLPLNMVAVDGKTIWVGKHQANSYCQLQDQEGVGPRYNMRVLRATFVSGPTQLCLGQAPIPADQNDMSAFAEFFAWLLKQYSRSEILQVISLDAGFASKENADLTADAQLGYLIALKTPQQALYAEATRLLGHRRKPDAESPWERVNGTRIRRLLFRTEEMAGWNHWSHLRQVWRVRQETEEKGETKIEERYFLTNLPPGPTQGNVPLQMVRAHWGIENGNNWTMDMIWNEDDCPWVSGALEVVSWLRLLAMNVVMRLRTRHLRSARNRNRPWKDLLKYIEDVIVLSCLLPNALAPPGVVEQPLVALTARRNAA
jgi:hypothetical protein